jgi:hypothetical protein
MPDFRRKVPEFIALLRFLRPGLLLLVALWIFRIIIGAIGVPESIGNWISSGTVLAMLLAIYYGYSAPSHGFNRYWQPLLIGWSLSVVENLMVAAGILITPTLGLAHYSSFTSVHVGVMQHAVNHLWNIFGSDVTLLLLILVSIGFLFGRRNPALKSQYN